MNPQNEIFYLFNDVICLYHNPDLDDSISNFLLSSMSDIQELDKKSSFIIVGDLNAHQQKWLKSFMVLQHLISQIFLAVNNSSKSEHISLVIVSTCCLLMFQMWWILWLILLFVILIIHLFYSLWKWVLKFLILLFLRKCIWSHVSIGLMLEMISIIPIEVQFIIAQI